LNEFIVSKLINGRSAANNARCIILQNSAETKLALLLQKIILMANAYDRKLVQNLCYLLSESVVGTVVVHPPLAVVHPLLL